MFMARPCGPSISLRAVCNRQKCAQSLTNLFISSLDGLNFYFNDLVKGRCQVLHSTEILELACSCEMDFCLREDSTKFMRILLLSCFPGLSLNFKGKILILLILPATKS